MHIKVKPLALGLLALSISTGAAFAEKPYETFTIAKRVGDSMVQTEAGFLFVKDAGFPQAAVQILAPNARAPLGYSASNVPIAPRSALDPKKTSYLIPSWGFRDGDYPQRPNLFSSLAGNRIPQVYFPAIEVEQTSMGRNFSEALVESEGGSARVVLKAWHLSPVKTNPVTGVSYFFADLDGWVRLWAAYSTGSRTETQPLSPKDHERNDVQFRYSRYMFPVGESMAFTGYAHVASPPDTDSYMDFKRVLWLTDNRFGAPQPVKSSLFEGGFVRVATEWTDYGAQAEAPPIASRIGDKLYFRATANRSESSAHFILSEDGTVKRLVDKYIKVGRSPTTWLFPHGLKVFPSGNPSTVLAYSEANYSLYEVDPDAQSARLISGPNQKANPCSFFTMGMSPIEIINGKPTYAIKDVGCVVNKNGVSMLDPKDVESSLIVAKLQTPTSFFIKDAAGPRVLAVKNKDLVLLKPRAWAK